MKSALVLNATFEPLSIVSVRRATCLVLSDKAELIENDGTEMRSERFTLASPLVVRLKYMVKVPYSRHTAMSRRAIMARDGHACQYCGAPADSIDHVLPKSRGGMHVWENVAAACRTCNLRKRDLQEDTPYNTYLRKGLPPTPISMPSKESIQAAIHPAASNVLFFVAKGDGTSHFSQSLGEHEKAVDQYQRKPSRASH
jgi:5-methylcytosine-specific restriction endonuclease McrA